jgi:alkylated DNA nucleotide flippase Atl1
VARRAPLFFRWQSLTSSDDLRHLQTNLCSRQKISRDKVAIYAQIAALVQMPLAIQQVGDSALHHAG